jgi:DNA gyrase/topoisomerase IV subunit A
MSRRGSRLALLAILLGQTACTTARPATELAAVTAQNAASLESQLSALTRQQQAISESRIAVLSRLHRETVEAEAARDRNIAFERAEGLTQSSALYEELRKDADASAKAFAEREAALAAARRALEERQKTVKAPTTALQDTSNALLAISEELPFDEHVKMLFSFFSDVARGVQKARNDAKEAEKQGDAKAKEAEKSTTPSN